LVFVEEDLVFGVPVILGQSNALESLVFRQSNQQPYPAFRLEYPEPTGANPTKP